MPTWLILLLMPVFVLGAITVLLMGLVVGNKIIRAGEDFVERRRDR